MLLSALLVKLESPRDPVFYHQERVGLNGGPSRFTSSGPCAPTPRRRTGPVWSAGDDDPRITRGRPLHAQDAPRRDPAAVERAARRHEPDRAAAGAAGVRRAADASRFRSTASGTSSSPGVTGWAQVRYTYGASVEDAIEKMQYDLYYVKHMSLMFDLLIALETIKTVVLRRGAR